MGCSLDVTCCIPTRYSLTILLMGVITHFFTLRSNFSIIVVAMVKYSPKHIDNSSGEHECYVNTSHDKYTEVHESMAATLLGSKGYNETNLEWQENSTAHTTQDKFSWDPITQGRILGAYSYGHVFSQVMGGFLEARFGGKKVLGLSMLLSSVLTLFTPVAAFSGEWWLFVVRVLVGFVQGVVYPSTFGMLSRWAPPAERSSLLTIASLGETFGVFIGFSLTAYLIVQCGWAVTLYITGAVGLAFCCLWCLLAFDSPAEHPTISVAERTYIEFNLEDTKKGRDIPWLKMLSSLHLWVLIYIHCTDSWGFYMILICLPLYMDTILNFDINANGGLSAVPYLALMATRILSSLTIDALIKQSRFRKVNIRKACVLGLVGVAACLVVVGHVRCDATAAIALLCLAMAMRGLMVPGFYPSYTDLTLGFSGVAFGVSNCVSNCTGFIVPLVVGVLTDGNQTIAAWLKVFYIGAAISVSGSVMALLFLRTDPVSWAQDPDGDNLSQPARDNLMSDVGGGSERTDVEAVFLYESTV
ncbi:sialin-like [Branchiostoma floridae]|uniref:Sialin-like n=1 Tax=Branchiostoma floridae TaxID=7739 RepID=A0A9J7MRR0_BRAFL|nr:sialin-like [Branchiostoma floridae]